MSLEPEIEQFSCELFHVLLANIVDTNWTTLHAEASSNFTKSSKLNKDIVGAIIVRSLFFQGPFFVALEEDVGNFSGSLMDFYQYLQNTSTSIGYLELPVMEAVFMSCVLVLQMYMRCKRIWPQAYRGHLYQVWSMFFDSRLKKRFYEQGSWDGLTRISRSYRRPATLLFISMSLDPYRVHVYQDFKTAADSYQKFVENRKNCEKYSLIKQWVEHQTSGRQAESSTSSPKVIKSLSQSWRDVENVLITVKRLTDPLAEEIKKSKISDCIDLLGIKFPTELKKTRHIENNSM